MHLTSSSFLSIISSFTCGRNHHREHALRILEISHNLEGMISILQMYFNVSYSYSNCVILGVYSDPRMCTDLQNNDDLTCLDINDRSLLQNYLDEQDDFTIMIDRDRSVETPMNHRFYLLLQHLQPGGLLIMENLGVYFDNTKSHANKNVHLTFFKEIVDLVNSIYFRGIDEVVNFSEEQLYYISWIAQINFHEGTVIVRKKESYNKIYERLVTGSLQDPSSRDYVVLGKSVIFLCKFSPNSSI